MLCFLFSKITTTAREVFVLIMVSSAFALSLFKGACWFVSGIGLGGSPLRDLLCFLVFVCWFVRVFSLFCFA